MKKCVNPTFSCDVIIATANPGGGKTDGGVSVRGHRTFLMLFADTCTLWSNNVTVLLFPSDWCQCHRKNLGREERKPFGRFGIESSHRCTFAGLREADAMLEMDPTPKSGLEPHKEWTHTLTQTLTQGKRGQPHGNYLFYFKIILFYLIKLFCAHLFVAMPLKFSAQTLTADIYIPPFK